MGKVVDLRKLYRIRGDSVYKRKGFEKAIILVSDLIGILFSAAVAFQGRYQILFGVSETGDSTWQVIGLCFFYVLLSFFKDFNKHFFRRGYYEELYEVIKSQFLYAIIWLCTLFILHRSNEFSRLLCAYFFAGNVIFLYVNRIIVKQYMTKAYKKGKHSNRVLLITTSDKASEIVRNFLAYNEWSRILTGLVIVDKHMTGEEIEGFPVVAGKETAYDYVLHGSVDEVFIHVPRKLQDEGMQTFVEDIKTMGIMVDVNIDIFDFSVSGKKKLDKVGMYNVVSFSRNVFTIQEMAVKRTLDIIGSLTGMVILMIAALLIAPAIKLESPGPVFFSQVRVGKNGRYFRFYKFRSMFQDAEKRKAALLGENEINGLMFKMDNDPRVTKVGRFLRRTSLDELPQFWNVLKGDMSLVGTRPPTIDEYERYEAAHKCRLSMTPGITGLWQISGRSDINDFDEVVKLDMEYIDNWSLKLDIKILLLTIKTVFLGSGAK